MHEALAQLMGMFQESACTSGSYVPAANRLLLMGLALSLQAKDILETGTSTGGTTIALAMTGARVVTIDHENVDATATKEQSIRQQRFMAYPNITSHHGDALAYLATMRHASFDLIFIDDGHWPEYTRKEIDYAQRLLRHGGVLVFHDTLSCHMWEVIEETLPSTWQRINLPSWQGGEAYTGTEKVAGVDFGLGVVRKPQLRADLMCAHEVQGLAQLERAPYSINICYESPQCTEIINEASIDAHVDFYLTLLNAWCMRPDLMDETIAQKAQKILFAYGCYCAQRADMAMRTKYGDKDAMAPLGVL